MKIFFNFPLVIYDDIESKTQINSVLSDIYKQAGKKFITFIKGENNEIKKIRLNANSLLNKSEIKMKLKRQKSITNPTIFVEYFSPGKDEPPDNKKSHTLNLKNAFKLNLKNQELKSKIEPYIISSKQLLDLFDFKYLNKKDEELNNCSTEEYINRININNSSEEANIKEENNLNESNHSNESLLQLKIYIYSKVVSLGKGNLFGELALRNPQAVRTATIITSTCCHFSILNRTTFNNCLKTNTEFHLKQQLSFFINLPIFVDIPITSFYKKYYTNISKYYIIKNNYILKQGEKPTRICLLNKGLYILMVNLNINELTDLIFFLLKKIQKYKNNITQSNSKNYKEIEDSLSQSIIEEKKILRDNINFRAFYNSESLIKITEIDCPDIIGYDELIGENNLYAFSVQAKTIENIIYSINYKFYTDLFNKNSSVKSHHEALIAIKLDLIIKRLFKIRNNTISSFFNHKIETDISAIISKELEDEKNSFTKLKRFLQFKSTKCNFYNKNDDLSITKDIFNEKDSLKGKKSYFKNKRKQKDKINIFTAYNNIFKNSSNRKISYKKLILPKTKFQKKNKAKYLFDLDIDNNKKEDKLNHTTYNPALTEEMKSNKRKEKTINIEIRDNNKLNMNKKTIINFLPIFNLRKRLKTEYSKIKYNQKYFIENSKEIKGKKINDSIRCYFEKKIRPSDSFNINILKKKREKFKSENKKINNALNKEKESNDLISSDNDNNMNFEIDNNSLYQNDSVNKYYYFKGNKVFLTPKNVKLNLLLLNNKSINFTNKDSLFHKSLHILTQKNLNVIKNLKSETKEKEINNIKAKSREDIKNNNNLNRENYMIQRDIYYKKNLTRMKFFYGLDKK